MSKYLLYVVCLRCPRLGQRTSLVFLRCMSLTALAGLWGRTPQTSFLLLWPVDRNGLVSPGSPSHSRMEIVASSRLPGNSAITGSKAEGKKSCRGVGSSVRHCCRTTATNIIIHCGLELIMPEFECFFLRRWQRGLQAQGSRF